ncbi:3'-5' exonuclease, partial [Amycolatopsis mediterranei]|uniref:3'-5' exonuclease n=1 Tax=Amycolatopsis mediterranei TaxID=33910 RepID=UPI0033288D57
ELAGGGQRSSDELLVEALRGGDILAGLADAEAEPVRRVGGLLRVTHQAVARGEGVEQVLWQLWRESGLQDKLLKQAERGGSLGAQADRDLDAVVALFDAAGRYVDRLPRSSVASFADYLGAQRIAGDTLAPAAVPSDGVSLLTAHAAAGREWTVVAVAGVQEGAWPDLRLRGSVLGVERLKDLMAGVDDDAVSQTAPILAEERRLFYLAMSRAKQTLLVTAVSGEDEQPSRFLDDLEENGADDGGLDSRMKPPGRSLVLAELVGELREVVCDDKADPARRPRGWPGAPRSTSTSSPRRWPRNSAGRSASASPPAGRTCPGSHWRTRVSCCWGWSPRSRWCCAAPNPRFGGPGRRSPRLGAAQLRFGEPGRRSRRLGVKPLLSGGPGRRSPRLGAMPWWAQPSRPRPCSGCCSRWPPGWPRPRCSSAATRARRGGCWPRCRRCSPSRPRARTAC